MHRRKPSLAQAKTTQAEQPLQYLHYLCIMNRKETLTSGATHNFHQQHFFCCLPAKFNFWQEFIWALSHIHWLSDWSRFSAATPQLYVTSPTAKAAQANIRLSLGYVQQVTSLRQLPQLTDGQSRDWSSWVHTNRPPHQFHPTTAASGRRQVRTMQLQETRTQIPATGSLPCICQRPSSMLAINTCSIQSLRSPTSVILGFSGPEQHCWSLAQTYYFTAEIRVFYMVKQYWLQCEQKMLCTFSKWKEFTHLLTCSSELNQLSLLAQQLYQIQVTVIVKSIDRKL